MGGAAALSGATPRLTEVEARGWDPLLEQTGLHDVYYSRGFVAASTVLAPGTPTLLHLGAAGGDVVFACVVRDDPVDVVTPYGYGGAVALGPSPPVAEFAAAYRRWCAERGVVSTFVVEHPLLPVRDTAAALQWRESELAGSVAWSLRDGDPFEGMHRHHRRLVRAARAAGLTATVEEAPADVSQFVELYEATMRRADADPFYFFAPAYWEALARDVPLLRVDVRDAGGTLVASVLGMGRPPLLHYHLGGAADAGRGSGASHLALLTLAEWGRAAGYETLHLGGGVGGRADSLLEYKRRFAPAGLVPTFIAKGVEDRAAYAALSGSPQVDWAGFFPAYRRPR